MPFKADMEATLTSKGQITIPKAVRDALKLRTGDRIDFQVAHDGAVTLVPVTRPVVALKGMLPKPKRAVSLAEMDAAIARGSRRK
jgi:AbrB family looped-hinge helix DNA binding protein